MTSHTFLTFPRRLRFFYSLPTSSMVAAGTFSPALFSRIAYTEKNKSSFVGNMSIFFFLMSSFVENMSTSFFNISNIFIFNYLAAQKKGASKEDSEGCFFNSTQNIFTPRNKSVFSLHHPKQPFQVDNAKQFMNWQQLISSRRLGSDDNQHEMAEYRTEFQRDYDRLIFSSPFRRLQNKTQVFPLPGSIFVHNRLTHSLEVSSVGRSLGNDAARELLSRHPELDPRIISMLGPIVSTACLAHDLGNPPFGHSGERAISSYFAEGNGMKVKKLLCNECGEEAAEWLWSDLVHFDGNANAFRLLTHQYEGRRAGGYVMTYSVLAAIVKYPYTSLMSQGKSKFGFFKSETPFFDKIAHELQLLPLCHDGNKISYARFPLAYFVEAADDICYEIMDIEDAHKLHILTTQQTSDLLLNFFDAKERRRLQQAHPNVTDPNERIIYLRSCVINLIEQECVRAFIRHEDEILHGQFHGALIDHTSKACADAFHACADYARTHIYKAREVLDIELAGYRIINMLLDLMTQAVLEPDKSYSRLLLDRVPSQYQTRHATLEGRIMGVIDYISGMTDVYALDLYRKITGLSLPVV